MDRRAVLVLLFALLASSLPQHKRYRDDYTYDARTDAFYKLHADGAIYERADNICKLEGAALLVPSSIQQIVQVHGMLKQFPDIGDYVWVGDDGEAHESAEEPALIDLQPEEDTQRSWTPQRHLVLTREGEIETYPKSYISLPFVCHVAEKSAPYDPVCDVYATGYEYKPDVGSCYRIPNAALTWNAAYGECKAQGAHLVVINSVAERDVVKTLVQTTPRLADSHHSWYHIVGIRAIKPSRVFRTIFNETLEEAGFAQWSWSEPNNLNDNEYCGSVLMSDGNYNDQNCANQYGFVCEKEKRATN